MMRGSRRTLFFLLFCGGMLLAGFAGSYLPPFSSTSPQTMVSVRPPAFDEARAWVDLEYQVAAGARVPGSAAHEQVRDWLVAQLIPLASSVTLQRFTHPLGGHETHMWNIIAVVPGTGRAPRERVLLAAHWDSRPTAELDSSPALRRQPLLGANDGASGVAVLLEIARQLRAHPAERDVLLIFFDGEDYGPRVDNMLLGSKYFAANLPKHKPDWGILLDMIGDKDLRIYREPNSDHYARKINDRVFTTARVLGYRGFVNKPGDHTITDDHLPLNRAGIPTVDLIDVDYPAWHTSRDTPAQCRPQSLAIVGKTVLTVLRQR